MSSKDQIAPELQELIWGIHPRLMKKLTESEYLQLVGDLRVELLATRQEFEELSVTVENQIYPKLEDSFDNRNGWEFRYDKFMELRKIQESIIAAIKNVGYLIKMLELFENNNQEYLDDKDFYDSLKLSIWDMASDFRNAYIDIYKYMND